MKSEKKLCFCYGYEIERDGVIIDRSTWPIQNLVPVEGLNHTMGVTFKGAAQATNWYIGLYEGNYTPNGSETAATIAGTSTECTAYAETTRVLFNSGAVVNGSVDNSANRAEFTMNANKTIYGGFLVSSAAKGSTSGAVVSAVKFPSPKTLQSGDIFRVLAGNAFI